MKNLIPDGRILDYETNTTFVFNDTSLPGGWWEIFFAPLFFALNNSL